MRQIIFGILFIVLGTSGEFALRGTNSPALLIIAGVILLIIGIIKLVGDNAEETTQLVPQEMTERQKMSAVSKACAHRKFEMRSGTSCGLTGGKPNFEGICINYSAIN